MKKFDEFINEELCLNYINEELEKNADDVIGYDNFIYLKESQRCTNVTLRAFGICVNEPVMTGGGVIEYLTNNGFTVKVHDFDYFEYSKKPLKKFIQNHPKGSYIISTRNHSMALIDGKLYDAAEGGLNRKVLYAFKVVK